MARLSTFSRHFPMVLDFAESASGWKSSGSRVHSFQDATFREQNLRFGVRGIRAVKEVRNRRCSNLFDLGGNKETSNTLAQARIGRLCSRKGMASQEAIGNGHVLELTSRGGSHASTRPDERRRSVLVMTGSAVASWVLHCELRKSAERAFPQNAEKGAKPQSRCSGWVTGIAED